VADQAEHGREQGDGGQHGHRDHAHRADGHGPEGLDVDEEHAGQGDDHGGPGQSHGSAGGGQGDRDRLGHRAAAAQLLAEAGDHEQGVVDADADADDRGGVGHVHVHVGDAGQEVEGAKGHPKADQGQHDRQAGRDQAGEGQQQHDQGDREADPLGLLQVVAGDLVEPLVEGGGSAGLDLDAGRHALPGRLGHQRRGVELGVLVAGEADHQVGGAPVGRDEGRAAGGGERRHAADPVQRPDPGGDALDHGLEGGVVHCPGPVVDGHQGGGRELVGEALLEVALHGQGLGAGHLEPARPEPVLEPGGEAGHHRQQHHPGADDEPPPSDGEGPEPSQQAVHVSSPTRPKPTGWYV
jgi:hypothetical protein